MRIERESTDLGLPHDDAGRVSARVQFGFHTEFRDRGARHPVASKRGGIAPVLNVGDGFSYALATSTQSRLRCKRDDFSDTDGR